MTTAGDQSSMLAVVRALGYCPVRDEAAGYQMEEVGGTGVQRVAVDPAAAAGAAVVVVVVAVGLVSLSLLLFLCQQLVAVRWWGLFWMTQQ